MKQAQLNGDFQQKCNLKLCLFKSLILALHVNVCRFFFWSGNKITYTHAYYGTPDMHYTEMEPFVCLVFNAMFVQ